MAFNNRMLVPHDAASPGSRIWTYFSDSDNKATIKGANYFDDGSDRLATGDTIRITASDEVFDAQVSISSGVVTLSALDTFA